LSPAQWQSRTTIGGALALQQFLNEGATDTKFISNLLMRKVRMILKEQDYLFAKVIRICNHPHILDNYYGYTQLETDLNIESLRD